MLTVFRPLCTDLELMAMGLAEKTSKLPELFRHLPVVIDLQGMADAPPPLRVKELARILTANGLVPVGVRGAPPEMLGEVLGAGLGVMRVPSGSARSGASAKEVVAEAAPPPSPPLASVTTLVERPVRSGQQVVSANGDLVIIGAASAGSELLAAGSIHVYGPLRGRALAGVNGNREARIFCMKMEAELLSIAGCYQLLEDRTQTATGPVQIRLQGERLRVDSL